MGCRGGIQLVIWHCGLGMGAASGLRNQLDSFAEQLEVIVVQVEQNNLSTTLHGV